MELLTKAMTWINNFEVELLINIGSSDGESKYQLATKTDIKKFSQQTTNWFVAHPTHINCLSSFLLYNIPPKIIYGSCLEYISALSKLQGQKEGVFSTVEAQLKWTKQAQGWDTEKKVVTRETQPMWDCEMGTQWTMTPSACLGLCLAVIRWLPAHNGAKPQLKPIITSAEPCCLCFKTCKAEWEHCLH